MIEGLFEEQDGENTFIFCRRCGPVAVFNWICRTAYSEGQRQAEVARVKREHDCQGEMRRAA